jgi:uncharacterized membrane protein
MKLEAYKRARIILIFLVMLSVFFSVYLNSFFLVLLSVGGGMVVISFLKTQIKDTIEDERVKSIHEKAARTAFKILMPILGLTSLALFYAGDGPFYFVRSLGIVLAYITCVGLLVYLVSYYYFNRRYGG